MRTCPKKACKTPTVSILNAHGASKTPTVSILNAHGATKMRGTSHMFDQ